MCNLRESDMREKGDQSRERERVNKMEHVSELASAPQQTLLVS